MMHANFYSNQQWGGLPHMQRSILDILIIPIVLHMYVVWKYVLVHSEIAVSSRKYWTKCYYFLAWSPGWDDLFSEEARTILDDWHGDVRIRIFLLCLLFSTQDTTTTSLWQPCHLDVINVCLCTREPSEALLGYLARILASNQGSTGLCLLFGYVY